MNTNLLAPPTSRRHRRHSAEFKAQVIAACMQPGVSIAAVALANQLNANFLRSWVKAHRNQQRDGVPANIGADDSSDAENCPPPTLVPITVPVVDAQPSGDIQIEIRRQHTVFQIAWPISQATACAQWLREVLQ
ncbi:MAG: transposase [Betaproteobacteria bacterium]|nr:transposase [Betaproteobacteria bacterium]